MQSTKLYYLGCSGEFGGVISDESRAAFWDAHSSHKLNIVSLISSFLFPRAWSSVSALRLFRQGTKMRFRYLLPPLLLVAYQAHALDDVTVALFITHAPAISICCYNGSLVNR
jgi:hypothetical protein